MRWLISVALLVTGCAQPIDDSAFSTGSIVQTPSTSSAATDPPAFASARVLTDAEASRLEIERYEAAKVQAAQRDAQRLVVAKAEPAADASANSDRIERETALLVGVKLDADRSERSRTETHAGLVSAAEAATAAEAAERPVERTASASQAVAKFQAAVTTASPRPATERISTALFRIIPDGRRVAGKAQRAAIDQLRAAEATKAHAATHFVFLDAAAQAAVAAPTMSSIIDGDAEPAGGVYFRILTLAPATQPPPGAISADDVIASQPPPI